MPDDDLLTGLVEEPPKRRRSSSLDRVRDIARTENIPDDIAEDYLRLTKIESGHNINVRDSHKGAQGFGQVMPDRPGGSTRTVGGRQFNLRNPDENIAAGLNYFAEGGSDPIGRRLYYFGGPRARDTYQRKGRIPNISDGNMTAEQYVRATGGQQAQKQDDLTTGVVEDDLLSGLVEESAPASTPESSKTLSVLTPRQAVSTRKPSPQKPPDSLFGGRFSNVDPEVIRKAIDTPPERFTRRPGAERQEVIRRAIEDLEKPKEFPSMQARQPGIIERIKETVAPYVPGLTSIDTPAGIKTDPVRGLVRGLTLGALGDSREITSDELLINPDAEADRDTAEIFGETAGALIPYVAAGKALGAIPLLSRAGRVPAAVRTGATFGGVETAREGIRSVKTGEPVRPEEIAISTAIGAAMGGIPGVNAGLTQRMFAAVGPQVTADVARGVPVEQAAQNAVVNVLFEASAGRKLGLSRKRIGELRAQIESSRTVPSETQRRLRDAENNSAAMDTEAGRLPAPEAQGKRSEAFGSGDAAQPQNVLGSVESKILPERQQRELRASDVREQVAPATLSPRPQRLPLDPEVLASVERGQRVREAVAPATDSPTLEARDPQLRDVPSPLEAVPEEGRKLNRWVHRDFGRVTEQDNQSGVGRGRVRVLAEDGSEHVIQRPNGRGDGNRIAIPERQTKPVEDLGFKVIDRRSSAKPAEVVSAQPKPATRVSAELLPREASGEASIPREEVIPEQIRPREVVNEATVEPKAEPILSEGKGASVAPEPILRERATPKTLERHGLEGGTDRLYEAETNPEQLRLADETISKHGIDAATEIARRSGDSGEQTALGISLVRQLQDAGKHEQAVDVASDLARRLTKAGQSIQAVNVVSRLSPERQVLAAQRIVQSKNPNAKLKPAQAEVITQHATKLEDAIARIATLEARIEEIKLQPKVGARKPKLETLNDRLVKAEQEARVRLAERAELMKVGGPERGASAIPADIADYAIIGASKLAQKGVTFASWSEAMVKDLGEEVRPKLRQIYRASYSTLNNERKAHREASEQRLARKEFEGPVRPEDLGNLVEQRRQAQRDARAARSSLAQTFNYLERGRAGVALDVAADVANLPRSIMSSLDLSAPLRQGGFFSLTETKASTKAAKDMISAISERGYDRVLQEIKEHPDFNLARRSGVEFTEVGRNDFNLAHTEEAYLSKIAGNLPLVKQSQQAYVAFLDSQRMQVFSKFANELKSQGRTMETHPEAYKYVAKFVNAGTGRGTLGRRGNQIAPYLNAVFFSPRFLASRVQLLNMAANPVAWANMPEGARAIIMRKNLRFASTVGTALGLAAAAGAKVSLDPDDADFLKVKAGNTHYDVLAGFQQPMRFFARMFFAVKAHVTKDDTYAGESEYDLATRFLRSKESPGFSFMHDFAKGDDYMGREFDLTAKSLDNPIASRALPMLGKDMAKAMLDEGWFGVAKTTPGFFGLGVQTYPEAPEQATTHAEKLSRKIVRDRMPDDARSQEEIDKGKKFSDLRARSRRGEDVSGELGALSPRQAKTITEAKGQTRLQEDFKKLSIKPPSFEAFRVYSTMTPAEKEQVKSILETKSQSIFDLSEDEQAQVRKKLEAIGMKPGIIRRRPREKQQRQARRRPGQGFVFQ